MEIEQKFISAPKPTLGSLKAGDVFLVDEKGLHDTSRVAYVKAAAEPSDSVGMDRVVRLTDMRVEHMGQYAQVTPVKAVLTLEVPFG
ncbi:hypothetical protein [Stutzerimonas stutzeri]|uniref:hypothetical protein n=1 Tax=Stutzerimonas stutzeri TaxID=316 RepID=UPI0030948C0B